MPEQHSKLRSTQSAETAVFASGLLAILAGVGLALLAPPPAPFPLSPLLYLCWILSIACALGLNITVGTVEINFVAYFVLAAFLTFGPGIALGIFISGLLLSEISRWVWLRFRHLPARGLRKALTTILDNLTVDGLALAVGGAVYYALGGSVPLVPLSTSWEVAPLFASLPALIGLELTYLIVSYGMGAWLLSLQGTPVRPFIGQYWLEIIALGFMPILLSFTLALAALNMPPAIFSGACTMLVLSIGIAHSLSLARVRLERRVRELDSLAAIGQTVANSLELPEVLEAIHQQTSHLMDARNFYIALYDEIERRINFPLAYENDQRVDYTSRLFGEGFAEYIILSRQPLLIKRDVQDFARQIGQSLADLQTRSWLGVPIAIGERVLGIIAVQSHEQDNMYDEFHRDILISIAAQAATAIRNSQMYMDVRRQTKNLFIINSVLTAINSTLKLDEVLNIIVTSLPHVVACQKSAIFLVDDQQQTVSLAASYNLGAEFVAQSRAIALNAESRAHVLATGEPLIISDLQTQPNWPLLQSVAEKEGFRALADLPLWAQDQTIGSLTAYYTEAHSFTPNEIEELTTFANQAAVAVANARLYIRTDQALARRVEQLATLQQIGLDLVSSLDLDEVMQHLLERAATAVNATYGAVGLWDEEHAVIRATVTYGYSSAETGQIVQKTWPVNAGLIGRAVRTGQSLFVSDVRLDPDYITFRSNVRSEMVALLKQEDRTLGVINLESPEVGRFDAAALDFINQLALQAVIALENAQLYRNAQSRLREMSILYEIGQRLTSILSLPRLGEELTRLMAHALNATTCRLHVYEPAAASLTIIGKYFSPEIAHADALVNQDDTYSLADFPELQTAIARHDLLISYQDDPTPSHIARQQASLQALLSMPLVLNAELIGVVEWGDERPGHRFGLGEVQFARTLANQATIAVHNAILFEDRTRRLRNLNELYQASLGLSTSMEVEEVLRRISAVAREVSRAAAVTLYIYDERADSFTRAHALGITGDWSPTHLRSTGMTRRVVKEGRAVLVAETLGHPEVNPHTIEAGIRSLIAVPLISQGQPMGVMYVGSYKSHHFDEGDVQLVSALAGQAAVAIANARLFSEIAESRDQLQAILDSASDGLLIFDLTTRIVLVNPGLETMWDMPHGWLNERQLINLLEEPDVALSEKLGYPPETLRHLLDLLRSGQTPAWNKLVYALPGQTPSRYVERSCQPVLDVERQPIGWMMVLRDVTEELELQRMRDDLSNTIIHDLRSPLSSILGSLYFMEETINEQPEGSTTRQALTISIRGANKLMTLVNSLLDIARLSSGQALVELQPQRLEAIADVAVDTLKPLALDSDITMTKEFEPDLPLVLIDEDKINRVIANLIDNALKYVPRGGWVNIKLDRWVENGAQYVRCTVKDNGPGIPVEYRTRIFERFVQISNRGGRRRGTGIGLNYCLLVTEAHGGRIWVEDTPGGGSSFSFIVRAVTD